MASDHQKPNDEKHRNSGCIYWGVLVIGLVLVGAWSAYMGEKYEVSEFYLLFFSALAGMVGSLLLVVKNWLPATLPESSSVIDNSVTTSRTMFIVYKLIDGLFLGAAFGALAIAYGVPDLGVVAYAFLGCYGVSVLKSLVKF